MIKHIIILADETAFFKVGGLLQIQRQLLNVREFFSDQNEKDFAITVFWRENTQKNISHLLKHALLKDLAFFATDDSQAARLRVKAQLHETVMIATNRLFGRKALGKILRGQHDSRSRLYYSFVPKDMSLVEMAGFSLWEKLSELFATSAEAPKENPKKGYYEYWAVLKNRCEISRHEKRMIYYLGKISDGIMGHVFNRCVSCVVTRWLIKLKISPNQWTAFMFFYFLLACWFLIQGTYFGFVIAAAIYYSVSILDGCDGEIARVTFTESKKGEWFDTVTDMIVNQLFILLTGFGLMKYYARFSYSPLYLVEGIVCVVIYMITLKLVNKFVISHQSDAKNFSSYGKLLVEGAAAKGLRQRILFFGTQLLKRDFYTIVILFLALCDLMFLVFHGLFLGTLGQLLTSIRVNRKSIRSQ